MPKPKPKKRKPFAGKTAEGFIIGFDPDAKPPTKKEIDAMRQREIVRRNPRGTV